MTDGVREFHGCTAEETAALHAFFETVSERQLQAWIVGHHAQIVLLSPQRTAEMEAEALSALVEAAAVCPFAAYALGKVLEEDGDVEWPAAEKAFRHCADLGLALVDNAQEAFEGSSIHRRVIRDVIGRAVTNIGSHYGNEGFPDKALTFFDRALEIDPGNRPALVSRANITFMNEGHMGRTALAAVEDWREADRSPRFPEGFDDWADGRRNVVEIVDAVQRNYGDAAAEKWASRNLPGLLNHRHIETLLPRIRRSAHLQSLAGIDWPAMAIDVAEHIHEAGLCEEAAAYPLELRVTLAGSLLATLSRGQAERADPSVLDFALELSDVVEPLNPLLGDHEWQELRRPHTDHLMDEKTVQLVHSHVQDIFQKLTPLQRQGGAEVALGVLFHLDSRFRHGVTQMMRSSFASSRPGFFYVPALSVG